MTYRNPYHGSPQGWGLGVTVAALSVIFVVVVFVLMYGMSNQSSQLRLAKGAPLPRQSYVESRVFQNAERRDNPPVAFHDRGEVCCPGADFCRATTASFTCLAVKLTPR